MWRCASPSSAVHDDEEEIGLTRQLAVDRSAALTGAGPSRQAPQRDLEVEDFSGHHLAAKARLVDPAEERESAPEPLVGEHRDPTQLGQGLDHEDSRQGRTAREMPGEEVLVTPKMPSSAGPLSGVELG